MVDAVILAVNQGIGRDGMERPVLFLAQRAARKVALEANPV